MHAVLATPDPSIYHSKNYVVLDFEIDTSHGDYGSAVHPDNKMLLGSYKTPDGTMRSSWGSEFQMGDLVRAIEQADFLVAHNAKYELMWLTRCGLDMGDVVVFDTKIAEYVLLGNLASGDDMMVPKSTSLDACCKRRGLLPKDPVVDIMMKQNINPVTMPRPWLQGRCERDVTETEKVFKSQLEHLTKTNRLPVLYTRCLLTPVLAALEFEGMSLDCERVMEEFESYKARCDELTAQMDAFTGGINWRSPKQSAEFIYDELGFKELKNKRGEPKRTKTKQRKTDSTTLAALRATTKRQREFVALRKELGKVAAALSKNLEFFKGICLEYNGVFHAEFNQTATATHRLSSSGIATFFEIFETAKKVQFQNLPRIFKRLFRARADGWLMAETDGSQLEFRTAAHQTKDEQAQADIISGHDVHRFTASVLNSVPEEEVTKSQRQDAKADTFKPVYGGSQGTKAQMAYYEAFKARYHQLASTQDAWAYEVLRTKRLITEWGMRYYWPFASMSQSGHINVKSSVYNYPVQALATAEIIPIALVYFWHRIREEGLQDYIKVVNTVHDSVICEVHPDYTDDYRRLSIQAFTFDVYKYLEDVYGIVFDFVPLGVGVTLGTHWGEGEEQSYNVYYDGVVHQQLDGTFQEIEFTGEREHE